MTQNYKSVVRIPLLDYSVIVQHDVRASVGIIHKLHTFRFLSDFSVLEWQYFWNKDDCCWIHKQNASDCQSLRQNRPRGKSPNWSILIHKMILGFSIVHFSKKYFARTFCPYWPSDSLDVLAWGPYSTGTFPHRGISARQHGGSGMGTLRHCDILIWEHFGNLCLWCFLGCWFSKDSTQFLNVLCPSRCIVCIC